ncbi:hypothetical protein AB8880_12290 [Alphaproteobacteria bacterium LSUCC0684]
MANDETRERDNHQEDELIASLKTLLADFSDYQSPILRADGDIVIPLDPTLKKNREAQKNLAEAISSMMNGDMRRRSSAWVE